MIGGLQGPGVEVRSGFLAAALQQACQEILPIKRCLDPSPATCHRHVLAWAFLRTQSSDPITSKNLLPLQDAAKTSHQSAICTADLANPHTFRQSSRVHHSGAKKKAVRDNQTTTMDPMPSSLEEWRNRLFHVTEVMTLTEEE